MAPNLGINANILLQFLLEDKYVIQFSSFTQLEIRALEQAGKYLAKTIAIPQELSFLTSSIP